MIIEIGTLTAILVGVGFIAKQIFPNRFVPLATVISGIVISIFLYHVSPDTGNAVLGGIIAGLSASGLYDNVAVGIFNKTLNKKE